MLAFVAGVLITVVLFAIGVMAYLMYLTVGSELKARRRS